MKSSPVAFICTILMWISLFSSIALIAKNFSSIHTPEDFLSYNKDTGRICILGERFSTPEKATHIAEIFLEELSEYYLSYTPQKLFAKE